MYYRRNPNAHRDDLFYRRAAQGHYTRSGAEKDHVREDCNYAMFLTTTPGGARAMKLFLLFCSLAYLIAFMVTVFLGDVEYDFFIVGLLLALFNREDPECRFKEAPAGG
jgi:hypothetical protein